MLCQTCQRCALAGNSMMRELTWKAFFKLVFRILLWFALPCQVQSTVQPWCVMVVNGWFWSCVNVWMHLLTCQQSFMDLQGDRYVLTVITDAEKAPQVMGFRSPLEFRGLGWGSQSVEAPNPTPTTEWLKAPYKMVLKCILRKNKSKPLCSNYFTNHFVEITSDFQEFYKSFCKAQSFLNQWVSIFPKKTTNHFVDVFVVFRKESKPFCKANPNLWPNPKICYKPFSSVPLKKSCVFSFFPEKKPFVKLFST